MLQLHNKSFNTLPFAISMTEKGTMHNQPDYSFEWCYSALILKSCHCVQNVMFWWITLWADNIFTILWWLLPWFASKSRDRCSICLAQLRQKAHKPKKNIANLEGKNLQIFLTVVDKVLCPYTPQTKIRKISICQNRLPKSHDLGLQYFHHVFFCFYKQEWDNSRRGEMFHTPPTYSFIDTLNCTWEKGDEIRWIQSRIRRNAFPKSQWSFSLVIQEVNKPSHRLTHR